MPRLVASNSGDLHLLSLLVRERLEDALETLEGRDLARKLKGRIGLSAGEMETQVVFDGSTIRIEQDAGSKPQARGKGTLASYFAVCRGKIRAGDVLRGQIKVSGNILLLRRFFPLLSVGLTDGPEEGHD